MKVLEGLPPHPFSTPVVATVGIFDGVHRGHQALIQRLVQVAQQKKSLSLVMTFWPHPRLVLQQDPTLRLLHTLEEKKEHLQALGVDVLVLLPFDKSFARTHKDTFIQEILIKKLGVQRLIVGYNHRFGKDREGSYESLKAETPHHHLTVEQVQEEILEKEKLSATCIRKALQDGNMETAYRSLGYAYHFSGTVIQGHHMGTSIGFPTANIRMDNDYKLLPRKGVYAVEIQRQKDMGKDSPKRIPKGISKNISKNIPKEIPKRLSKTLPKGMLYIGKKR